MKQFLKITFALLPVLLVFSCKNSNNNDVPYGRQVMKEIFPALMDSLYLETMFLITPPPAEEVKDSITGKINIIPIPAGRRNKDLFRQQLKERYNDSAVITLVVNDEVHETDKNVLKEMEQKIYHSPLTAGMGYRFSPGEIVNGSLCKAVSYAAYTQSMKKGNDPFVLKDFSFTTIVFNKELNRGFLQCDYVCGSLCGFGFRILINKEKERWGIERVELLWVS